MREEKDEKQILQNHRTEMLNQEREDENQNNRTRQPREEFKVKRLETHQRVRAREQLQQKGQQM